MPKLRSDGCGRAGITWVSEGVIADRDLPMGGTLTDRVSAPRVTPRKNRMPNLKWIRRAGMSGDGF